MSSEIAFSEYIKNPVYKSGYRRTLSESLGEADPSTLPQRKADDISNLLKFFKKVIFVEQRLEELEVVENVSFYSRSVVVPHDELIMTLGEDYIEKYSYRDWNDALKLALETHAKESLTYGDNYRTIHDFDEKGGLFIGVNRTEEKPISCVRSSAASFINARSRYPQMNCE